MLLSRGERESERERGEAYMPSVFRGRERRKRTEAVNGACIGWDGRSGGLTYDSVYGSCSEGSKSNNV